MNSAPYHPDQTRTNDKGSPVSETVTVRRDDLEQMMAYLAAGPWTPADKPEVAEAWRRLTEAKDAGLEAAEAAQGPQEPPLPPGQFARIELPGYRNHTGWVTEETRFGAQTAVVRDWDGREVAAVALGPGCQVLFLPTPLRRPEPELAALPAGEREDYYREGYFDGVPGPADEDDGEPADAFAGRAESPEPF